MAGFRSWILLCGVLVLAACASFVRTEGMTETLAWRVTDLASVTRTIEGEPTDTYAFTLIIKNITDRTLTLERMHRTVYQAGGGGAGRSSTEGRWELRPGAEWTFPLYSYTYCRASQGCLTRGGAQPLWQIVLAGSDDQHRPVESRFEIMLPPRPARYVDLAPTRRASPSAERPPTAGTPAPGAPASLPASTAPTGWRA